MFDKKDWQSLLRECDIHKGDNIIIGGSLFNEVNTIDGWPTCVEALLGMVGAEGTLMSVFRNPRSEPLHQDPHISNNLRTKIVKQWNQSSYAMNVSHPLEIAFMLHDEMRSIHHAGYRFYAIGKYAPFIVRKVLHHFPLHDDGPLQAAIKLKAKYLHFGDDESWVVSSLIGQTVIVNSGIINIEGIAKWDTFLDKEPVNEISPTYTWNIGEEKIKLYELNKY